MLGVALGGSGLAVLLHLPWSIDFLLPGTTRLVPHRPPAPGRGADLATLLRFQVGPLGGAPLGYALLVAAALPLLIGQGQRHAWAVRGWTLALASWGLAWAAQQDVLPFALPAPEVLLVPAAVGLALATAMGVAAFQEDLPGYRFGWRQIASGVAAAAVALACLPVLGRRLRRPLVDARRRPLPSPRLHRPGEPRARRSACSGSGTRAPSRLAGWHLADGLAYATTDGGTPRLEDLLVGSDDGTTGLLADAVDLARTGQTARLGRLLAPMGIRYVVLPGAPGPRSVRQSRPGPPRPASRPASTRSSTSSRSTCRPAWPSTATRPPPRCRASVARADVPPTDGGIAAAADLDLSHLPGRPAQGRRHPALDGHAPRRQLPLLLGRPLEPLAAAGRRPRRDVGEAVRVGDGLPGAGRRARPPCTTAPRRPGTSCWPSSCSAGSSRCGPCCGCRARSEDEGRGASRAGSDLVSDRRGGSSRLDLAHRPAGRCSWPRSSTTPPARTSGPAPAAAVQAGVAIPAGRARPPACPPRGSAPAAPPATGGFADHVVLMANPSDQSRTATITALAGASPPRRCCPATPRPPPRWRRRPARTSTSPDLHDGARHRSQGGAGAAARPQPGGLPPRRPGEQRAGRGHRRGGRRGDRGRARDHRARSARPPRRAAPPPRRPGRSPGASPAAATASCSCS